MLQILLTFLVTFILPLGPVSKGRQITDLVSHVAQEHLSHSHGGHSHSHDHGHTHRKSNSKKGHKDNSHQFELSLLIQVFNFEKSHEIELRNYLSFSHSKMIFAEVPLALNSVSLSIFRPPII